MIQRDQWRLIWSAYGLTDELYDLEADPDERLNLAGQFPEIVSSMKAKLELTPRYWVRSGRVEPSEATLEQLRALGYIR